MKKLLALLFLLLASAADAQWAYWNGTSWTPTNQAPSPLTTKGDLFTFSNAPARLAVGTNGQALIADSTTATGLKWASASGMSGLTTGTIPKAASSSSIADSQLLAEDANTLAARNGTTAQTLRLYRTYTDASNFQVLSIKANDGFGAAEIRTLGSGTGSPYTLNIINSTAAAIQIGNSTNPWNFDSAGGFSPAGSAGLLGIASSPVTNLYMNYTNTATVGAVTINKAAGRVNVAATATTVVVTNSVATAAAHIFAIAAANDTTCAVKDVEAASGSFTIRMTAACTADTAVNFLVINAD